MGKCKISMLFGALAEDRTMIWEYGAAAAGGGETQRTDTYTGGASRASYRYNCKLGATGNERSGHEHAACGFLSVVIVVMGLGC